MNKNSTHGRTRNFASKISAFFTILPALPAMLQRTGGYVFVQYANLAYNGVVSRVLTLSSSVADICSSKLQLAYFFNRRLPQLRLHPVTINQFNFTATHKKIK